MLKPFVETLKLVAVHPNKYTEVSVYFEEWKQLSFCLYNFILQYNVQISIQVD